MVFAQTDATLAIDKFDRLLRVVNERYVDTVDSKELVDVAIRSMLEELDPHSVYLTKAQLDKANEPLLGKFEGVGIQFNLLRDTIVVVSPIAGGPSEKLGIRSGDKIIKIEDKVVAGVGFTNKDVMDHLRGDKGTQVNISMQRRGVKKLLDFEITRDKIPIFSVDASYMATPEIGYIKLNRFSATTMTEIRTGMEGLQKEGMKHLILDLRGNSGGYLSTAIRLADEFLPENKLVVYTEGRASPRKDTYATNRGNFEEGKLVVLIDEGSASASEIVSGAIQDWDRGLLIGRRSYGKGLVQKPFKLPDGSAVRLTISRYYTPTGRSIQRPYDEGSDQYRQDLRNRFTKGELSSSDSIELPDSLKYYTPGRRLVYGGGGIMPDIFVPIDTQDISDYYTTVRRKGLMNDFVLIYLDENREKLIKDYSDNRTFNKKFEMTAKLNKQFTDFVAKEGVEFDQANYDVSAELMSTQLKALLGRSLFDNSAYYEVYNNYDKVFKKAIESIESNVFEKMKLSYK